MEELIEIGKTLKSHGVDGDLRFAIEDEYLEDFLSVEVVFLQQKGQPVPYFINEIKGIHLVVDLDEVDDKETAKKLAAKKVLIRKGDLIPEEEKTYVPVGLEYDPVIGFLLIDTERGEIGRILEIEEYPQQEMALVEYKTKEIMIPMNGSFIQSIDKKEKKIIMSLPEGMLDLQL
ncbi:MAG: 16S rRNA processing protein RimM [Maribacter sp.]|jgi:16S rRNA processing protein RimM